MLQPNLAAGKVGARHTHGSGSQGIILYGLFGWIVDGRGEAN